MNASIVGRYSWYSYKEKKEWALKKSQYAYSRGDKTTGDMFSNISDAYRRAEIRAKKGKV